MRTLLASCPPEAPRYGGRASGGREARMSAEWKAQLAAGIAAAGKRGEAISGYRFQGGRFSFDCVPIKSRCASPSSNGRTPDFESDNRGSNPRGETKPAQGALL